VLEEPSVPVNGTTIGAGKSGNSVTVLGVSVDALTLDSAVNRILGWVNARDKHYVPVVNVHSVIEAQQDEEFKSVLNNGGLAVADGMPLVWRGRLAGTGGIERITGPDLMLAVNKELGLRNKAVFYYGSTADVVEELARLMEVRCSGLKTAGVFSPPFHDLTAQEKLDVVNRINQSGADVVWVGLGCPKQERWMAKMIDLLDVPVLVGVGAAFDYHTGRLRRSPLWMQRFGLEWCYRLAQEPRRLWRRYLRTNSLFLFYTILEMSGIRKF